MPPELFTAVVLVGARERMDEGTVAMDGRILRGACDLETVIRAGLAVAYEAGWRMIYAPAEVG